MQEKFNEELIKRINALKGIDPRHADDLDGGSITDAMEVRQKLLSFIDKSEEGILQALGPSFDKWKEFIPRQIKQFRNFLIFAATSVLGLLAKNIIQSRTSRELLGYSTVKNISKSKDLFVIKLLKALTPGKTVEKTYGFFTKFALGPFYRFAWTITLGGLSLMALKLLFNCVTPAFYLLPRAKRLKLMLSILKSDNPVLSWIPNFILRVSPNEFLQTGLTLLESGQISQDKKEKAFYLKSAIKLLSKISLFACKYPNGLDPSISEIAKIQKRVAEYELSKINA